MSGQHGASAGHGPVAHEERYSRHIINRMGMATFLAGEATLIFALLVFRLLLTGLSRSPYVNTVLGGVMTVLLLASVATATLALRGVREGNRGALGGGLAATMALGGLFLVLAASEWAVLFGRLPVSDIFGSVFYLMAGLDHLHIAVGLLLLGVALLNRRKFGPHDYWGVEGPVWFWYFAVAFWLVVFIMLYLL